jgi:hypothetical protein
VDPGGWGCLASGILVDGGIYGGVGMFVTSGLSWGRRGFAGLDPGCF